MPTIKMVQIILLISIALETFVWKERQLFHGISSLSMLDKSLAILNITLDITNLSNLGD